MNATLAEAVISNSQGSDVIESWTESLTSVEAKHWVRKGLIRFRYCNWEVKSCRASSITAQKREVKMYAPRKAVGQTRAQASSVSSGLHLSSWCHALLRPQHILLQLICPYTFDKHSLLIKLTYVALFSATKRPELGSRAGTILSWVASMGLGYWEPQLGFGLCLLREWGICTSPTEQAKSI